MEQPNEQRLAETIQRLQSDPAFLAAIEKGLGRGGPASGGEGQQDLATAQITPQHAAAAAAAAAVA